MRGTDFSTEHAATMAILMIIPNLVDTVNAGCMYYKSVSPADAMSSILNDVTS